VGSGYWKENICSRKQQFAISIFVIIGSFCLLNTYIINQFYFYERYNKNKMAYLIGAYQYFDDQFIKDARNFQTPNSFTPSTPLLSYLHTYHPKWLWIMKNARRQNYFTDDTNQAYTLFLPDEGNFTDLDLINFDKDYCLRLFNKFTVKGYLTKSVLQTSPNQQISSLKPGESLYIQNSKYVNNEFVITKYDILFDNICIHIINHL
jgi:hypothetical protein